MKKLERDFKGVWIPKEVWNDDSLTWMEKLFLVEIDSLDKDRGCFASNSYFSVFFNLSNGRCSQIINSLIEKKYIKCSYKKEGKQIKERVLNILNRGIKYSKEGYLENAKDNNTVINNTVIKEKIYKKESKHKHGEYNNVLLTSKEYNKLIEDLGEQEAMRWINVLSEGLELKGYKYKSHNLAIRKWRSNEQNKKPDGRAYPTAKRNFTLESKEYEA